VNERASVSSIHVRLAHADDDDFILGLASRFAEFDLPPWRKRSDTIAGIRRDIEHHLRTLPPGSHLYVAEDDDAERVGFLHLQSRKDFFTGAHNCHISDLAVTKGHEGRGVARAMLDFAESWAKEHRCRHLTLGVFPGNERARAVYEKHGFGVEILSMAKTIK
jgi:ribosomal protein S18 acetylase RimI-like enzyme